MDEYKHYIRTNEAGIVIHGFSSAFEEPREGDVEILGEHARHFQLQLMNGRGQYRFRYTDDELIERSQEALDAEWDERPAPPPTPEERIAELEAELLTAKFRLAAAEYAAADNNATQQNLIELLIELEVL